jgi:hypothetical protein
MKNVFAIGGLRKYLVHDAIAKANQFCSAANALVRQKKLVVALEMQEGPEYCCGMPTFHERNGNIERISFKWAIILPNCNTGLVTVKQEFVYYYITAQVNDGNSLVTSWTWHSDQDGFHFHKV